MGDEGMEREGRWRNGEAERTKERGGDRGVCRGGRPRGILRAAGRGRGGRGARGGRGRGEGRAGEGGGGPLDRGLPETVGPPPC